MGDLRLILGDQLTPTLSALHGADRARDVIALVEIAEEATYVPHHKQKLVLIFTAMRRFADELRDAGFTVAYTCLDDPDNTGTFGGEIARLIARHAPRRVILTEPGEYRIKIDVETWAQRFGLPVDIRPDIRFFCSADRFAQWAHGKKQVRMEYFYREMRRQTGLLMDADGQPVGGAWNYDKDNRAPPLPLLRPPARRIFPAEAHRRAVGELVMARFADHFGDLDPFIWATSRSEALIHLDDFITHALPYFGTYQDAMLAGEPFMYHAVLSAYLNIGLLLPAELCARVEQAYHDGDAPLNAVEGFIRQILGWREYVRGIYWRFMPDYATQNALAATEPLPSFYWDGKTGMRCVAEAVRHTRMHAYSHHIQRLMITGNFALIAGIDPKAVCDWYLAVYADAFEWVELPNTLGMALFADGGRLASKPYAASGKYIARMSNYCAGCRYDPQETTGAKACPFNALYWDFMARNRDRLQKNTRLSYSYASWDRMDPTRQSAITAQATSLRAALARGAL